MKNNMKNIKLKDIIQEKIYDSEIDRRDLKELEVGIKKLMRKFEIYSNKDVSDFINKKVSEIIKRNLL